MADDLSQEQIESCLAGALGRPLRFFDSIGSTNSEAMDWALQGAPHGALVAADHQTAGRGRWGRSWFSKPGALLQFSLILRPDLPVNAHGLLTAGLGVAAARSIDRVTGLRTRIKWPNDITVDGKKIVGMLVETSVLGSNIAIAICGVGMNVHLASEDLPDEISRRASSIAISLGPGREAPVRAELLCAFLREMEEVYGWLGEPNSSERVIAEATERSEVLGREVVVQLADGTELTGTAKRLQSDGALELSDGADTRALHVGEIAQLREVSDAAP